MPPQSHPAAAPARNSDASSRWWSIVALIISALCLTEVIRVRHGFKLDEVIAVLAVPAALGIGAYLGRRITAAAAITGYLLASALWLEFTWRMFVVLALVFAFTVAATHIHASKSGTRSGLRSAGQIFANIGFAGIMAAQSAMAYDFAGEKVLALAVLAEAAADTVSSELGEAFGGRPRLLTTLRRVTPGEDGGITLVGTIAGNVAALLVGAAAAGLQLVHWREALIASCAGAIGMFFDSLLGATVERSGWLSNNAVNFTSTLFAAGVAYALLRYL
jgi:uncharacterized protein (TIGR00297 family)